MRRCDGGRKRSGPEIEPDPPAVPWDSFVYACHLPLYFQLRIGVHQPCESVLVSFAGAFAVLGDKGHAHS